jgi:hypothetical protein
MRRNPPSRLHRDARLQDDSCLSTESVERSSDFFRTDVDKVRLIGIISTPSGQSHECPGGALVIDGLRRRSVRTGIFRLALTICSFAIGGLLLSGTPALASPSLLTGIAVDNSGSSSQDPWAGDLYVATGTEWVDRLGWSGQYEGRFAAPEDSMQMGKATAIAVDSSNTASTGDLYVADREAGVVYVFKPTWLEHDEVVRELTGLSEPDALTVDNAGNVYVAQSGPGNVLEFSSSGEPLNEGKPVVEGLGGLQGLAIDTAGDLYVADNMGIVKFTWANGGFSAPKVIDPYGVGMAVDSSTGDVYVLRGGSCASTGEGVFTVEEIEPSGNRVTTQSCVDGGAVGIVESEATKTVYVAANEEYLPESAKLWAFVPAPVVLGEYFEEVSVGGAVVWGALGGDSKPTRYWFEYGLTSSYGAQTPSQEVPAGIAEEEAWPEGLSGLLPDTEYHYRLVAENETGVTEGEDRTFKTEALPPVGSAGTAQGSRPEATLEAGQADSEPPATAIGSVLGLVPEQGTPSPRRLTDVQRLARALKTCEKKPRSRRAVCERQARKLYRASLAKQSRREGK